MLSALQTIQFRYRGRLYDGKLVPFSNFFPNNAADRVNIPDIIIPPTIQVAGEIDRPSIIGVSFLRMYNLLIERRPGHIIVTDEAIPYPMEDNSEET